MAESKSSIATIIPVFLPCAVLGGLIGYLMESGTLAKGGVAGLVALGFGLVGGLLALLARVGSNLDAASRKSDAVQEDLAGKISEAVTKAQSGFADQFKGAEKTFSTLVGKLEATHASSHKSMEAFTSGLQSAFGSGQEGLASALKQHSEAMNKLGDGWSEQIFSTFKEHREMLQTALDELSRFSEGWLKQLDTSLHAHTQSLEKANQSLIATVSRIGEMGSDIEKLLHMQQAIDATLETMAKTEDFKKTIGRLSEHLEASDRLLQQVSKPRQIRLVESHGE